MKQLIKQLDPFRLFRELIRDTRFYPVYKRLGQHPDYFYWLMRGKPQRTPHLVKQRAVLEYARKYKLDVLIETGTYYGEMVEATMSHFEEIYSIEFDSDLAGRARERFAKFDHIKILQGDSAELVQELLKSVSRPTLFWLDAGYYGFGGEMRGTEDRLIIELESILGHQIKEHVILMDDTHGLNGENGSPTVNDLIERLESKFPNRSIEIDYRIMRITPCPAASLQPSR